MLSDFEAVVSLLCICQLIVSCFLQGEASRWAAQRIREQKHLATKFDAVQAAREDRPVYFTGEVSLSI